MLSLEEPMPEISRFFGIVVMMFYNDHAPPHFHADYGDEEWEIGLQPVKILKAGRNRRVQAMLLEWAVLHQDDLLEDWHRCRNHEAPRPVEPLE
jgi:hypothetical protein